VRITTNIFIVVTPTVTATTANVVMRMFTGATKRTD